MTLSPVAMHETLDERGLLDQSHGPGCYAVQVETPSEPGSVEREFHRVSDASPADKAIDKLALAERVAYVGASGNVYDRLQDHCAGDVRKALFLQCFDIVDVVGVWPSDNPFQDEYNRARDLSQAGYTVWTDGEVL